MSLPASLVHREGFHLVDEMAHPFVYFPAVVDMYWCLDLGRETIVDADNSHFGVLCHQSTKDILRIKIAEDETTTMSCEKRQYCVFVVPCE
jgi:hypothetical protein